MFHENLHQRRLLSHSKTPNFLNCAPLFDKVTCQCKLEVSDPVSSINIRSSSSLSPPFPKSNFDIQVCSKSSTMKNSHKTLQKNYKVQCYECSAVNRWLETVINLKWTSNHLLFHHADYLHKLQDIIKEPTRYKYHILAAFTHSRSLCFHPQTSLFCTSLYYFAPHSIVPSLTSSLENSRASRIAWLLEELNVDYEIKAYPRTKEYLAPKELLDVFPTGMSPVLTIIKEGSEPLTIGESGHIVNYLIEYYDKNGKFTPKTHNDKELVDFYLHFSEEVSSPIWCRF